MQLFPNQSPAAICHLPGATIQVCRYLESLTASSEEFKDRNTQVTLQGQRKAEGGNPLPATCTKHSEFAEHPLIKLH